jgi:hypothetical protein
VVFDEENFPLTASPSLTDLDFLCESGPTVSTIGTHHTPAGTSPPAPRRPALEIPPGFEPPVANLPTPAVPPGFLPQAAITVVSPPITIGLLPCTWPAREVGAGAMGACGTPGAALLWEVGAGATGTRGAPGASPSPKVGAGAMGTRGTPGAALRQEVGVGAAGTRGRPRSCPAPGGGHQSR